MRQAIIKFLRGDYNSVRYRFLILPRQWLHYVFAYRLFGKDWTMFYTDRMNREAEISKDKRPSDLYLEQSTSHLEKLNSMLMPQWGGIAGAFALVLLVIILVLIERPDATRLTTPPTSVVNEADVGKQQEASGGLSSELPAPEVVPGPPIFATEISSSISPGAESSTTENTRGRVRGASTPLSIILLFIVTLLLAAAVALNLWLFKWRRLVGNDQLSIVPSELLNEVKAQKRALSDGLNSFSKFADGSAQRSNAIGARADELMEAFSVLQNALDGRDKEIKRLQRGYDNEIFRRFLSRFLRVDVALGVEINDARENGSKSLNALEDVRAILRDALEDCGVEEFSPELGESVKTAFGIDDGHKTRATANAEEIFTIAEVIETGFLLRTPDQPECIKAAKVEVFVPQSEEPST